jgi:soluble lytic murein transglycosylase-like protein
MRVPPRQSDPFFPSPLPSSELRLAVSLAAAIMAGKLDSVHAQSAKPADRIPHLPAAIAIDGEGVARDARETASPPVASLPDVERPDLPRNAPDQAKSHNSGPAAAERDALIAAARRRHQPREAREIETMVRRIAAELGFDAAYAVTIARIESDFDMFAVSDQGAIGVMQLMPAIVADQQLADPFDPEANIRAGIRHLKALGQEFRHPVLVAAAYHAGAEAVRQARGIPQGPRTAGYVVAVLNGFYDLMAITGPDAGRRDKARRTAARQSSPTPQRNTLRVARGDAAGPTNPTGIWERGFVLHLD